VFDLNLRSSCLCMLLALVMALSTYSLFSHSDRDEKTTRVCVFHSQPPENISFLFSEQDCVGCSCNSSVGGNSFGANTGDCLLVLNTDP